jgi:Serine carboxypeptidase
LQDTGWPPGCGITLHLFPATQILACNNGGTDAVCSAAQDFCNNNVFQPLAGDWDVYYVPTPNPDPYPPPFDNYLNDPSVASQIGSEVTWQITNSDVYNNFAVTGDSMRSSQSLLEMVINEGVRTVIYDGDADFILNFNGVEAMVRTHPYNYAIRPLSSNLSYVAICTG